MHSLIESFIQVAKEHPDKLAVKSGQHQINYGDLLSAVDAVAYWMTQQGLNKGSRVGIHLHNSIEFIVIYYACWRNGCIPVALNVLASSREMEFWLNDSGCELVFSQKLKPEDSPVPVVEAHFHNGQIAIRGRAQVCPQDFIFTNAGLQDVATILYTSGTTGNPKGITLQHLNLATNIYSIIESLDITSHDRFLCVLPFFYSFGNSILHTHLVSGSTLILLNQVMYPSEILKTIEQDKCHGFAGVPSLYISLLKKTHFDKFDLSSLRYMTQAGGPLAKEFIEQINLQLPEAKFVVMYGQTEASARISYLPAEKLEAKLGSVGVGIPGVTISILYDKDKECAVGEIGEICISGNNVMSGYWNNPKATQKVLRDSWLHTGDMGYKDQDSFLFIVGRQTEILKISEHRVSPYEIEEVILQLDAIEECAVIGCSHEQLGQFAKAFVVPRSEISTNEIKQYCKQNLAGFKIPKEIELVTQLPKTPSGKIKRAMLAC